MSIIAVDVQRGDGGISKLKGRLLKMDGVKEVEFNYAIDKLTVKYDGDVVTFDQIRKEIRELCNRREVGDG